MFAIQKIKLNPLFKIFNNFFMEAIAFKDLRFYIIISIIFYILLLIVLFT
jgi:hypothetical protein